MAQPAFLNVLYLLCMYYLKLVDRKHFYIARTEILAAKEEQSYQNFSPLANGTDLNRQKSSYGPIGIKIGP